ncbi:MAG TPA: hypothetical protein VH165_33520 [Kofleriaceae bacterium]|jgi:hypothetical protein|nr:hypothetical protein [Kofleriaceae bacterium]
MWLGEPRRVTLKTDLTRYHDHLVPGVTGQLVPELQVGVWGALERFVAVRFDCCGTTMDILLESLEIEEPAQAQQRAAQEEDERWRNELRTVSEAILHVGPRGELRRLSITYRNERGSTVFMAYSNRTKVEEVTQILREYGIEIQHRVGK